MASESKSASDTLAELRPKFEAAGQAHVFKWADEGKLSDAQQAQLATQLAALDLDRINKLFTDTMAAHSEGISAADMEPVSDTVNLGKETPESIAAWRELGLRAIAAGEVGVILLAGGQGTRLGFDKPKGMYDIGLPTGPCLFEMQAAQIDRLRVLAAAAAGVPVDGVKLPWYVMTSPQTDADTRKAFEDAGFYGLNPDDVVFFSQGTLPCLTTDGKIIMQEGHVVASAPDGNGGIYHGLVTCGILDDMKTRGVKYVPQYCVDNACCKVADPVLVGCCIEKGGDVGGKAVAKTGPSEKVGVFCKVKGAFNVVEYSDISEEAATMKDPATGELVFSAGHVCINYYTREYFERICTQLPSVYHVASKKIPYADEDGATVKPETPNGIKLESFIFDVFPLGRKPVVLECATRFGEFAPVKNAPGAGVDSPVEARQMASDMFRQWLTAAGAKLSGDGDVYVSPRVSYGGEGLAAFSGVDVATPVAILPGDEAAVTPSTTAEGVAVLRVKPSV